MNLNFLGSISALMSLNFVILTPSLYVEIAKPTDTNFSYFYSDKTIFLSQQSNLVSAKGFDFEFTGCKALSSDELICSFLVKNNQQARTLLIWPNKSRIIDKEGNIIMGAAAQFGNKSWFTNPYLGSEELPSKITISGRVLFRKIPAGGNIQYVEFNFNQFKIWFSQGS